MSWFIDSPYRTAISGAVLKLQEEGKLHILKVCLLENENGNEKPNKLLNIGIDVVFITDTLVEGETWWRIM